MSEPLDVVYPVRHGANEELRYSLRSLRNLPHRSVWIIGDPPDWVNRHTVNVVRRSQLGTHKYNNSSGNIRAACVNDEVTDDFIVFHDDFFVMEPIESIPVLHRGPVEQILGKWLSNNNTGDYYRGLVETNRILQSYGIRDALCYELHIPRVVNKRRWIEASNKASLRRTAGIKALHNRTFYGNYWQIGGECVEDVKVYQSQSPMPPGPFVSTTDRLFTGKSVVGAQIRRSFPDKSPYER